MHAHTCTGPCVHKSVHAQVQRPELTLGVFSTAFQFIFQWWVSPRTWTSLILASLAGQVALGISSLLLECWDCRQPTHQSSSHKGSRDLNSGPHTCAVCTSPGESSTQAGNTHRLPLPFSTASSQL